MIKKFTFLLLIFISLHSFSQNTIKTTISDIIEHEAKFSKARGEYFQSSTLVSDKLDGYFMVKMNSKGAPVQKPKSYSIYHYDQNFKLKSETEYLINRNSAFLGGVFINDNKINIIQKVKSKTNKKNYDFEVISSTFDSNEFEKSTLLSFPKKDSFFAYSQDSSLISKSTPSGVYSSKSGNFFSIITRIEGKNQNKFMVYAFDNSTNKIYETEFTLEGKESRVSNVSMDDINGFIIADCNIKKGKKIVRTKILKIDSNKILELKIPDEYLYGYIHQIGLSDQKFAIVAFASKKEEGIIGISVNSYEKNGTLINSKFNTYSEEFFIEKYRKIKPLNYKNFTYRLDFVASDSDDNIYFSCQEYTRPTTTTLQNSLGSYNSFNFPAIYDDILIGKISKEGNMLYSRNVKNKTGKANYSIFNDKLYIIAKGSSKSEKTKEFGDTNKPNIYLLETTDQGTIGNLNKIADYKNIEASINPNTNFKQIESSTKHTLITRLGQEKNKRQYIKISN